jgi:hypothetical protein
VKIAETSAVKWHKCVAREADGTADGMQSGEGVGWSALQATEKCRHNLRVPAGPRDFAREYLSHYARGKCRRGSFSRYHDANACNWIYIAEKYGSESMHGFKI